MILFGLSNILNSFQNYINKMLAKKINVFMIFYLNNIMIYTKNINKAFVNAI